MIDAMGWLPIESAPKDGTVVRLYVAGKDGLPPFETFGSYNPFAGWLVCEIRETVGWMPVE